jgi:hypothetical protein
VAQFLISCVSECDEPGDLRPSVSASFQSRKGSSFETDFGLGKAAFALLAKAPRFPVAFQAIFQEAKASLGIAEDTNDCALCESLCRFFLQLYAGGMVELRSTLPPATALVADRPVASPVARWQIEHGDFVTSVFHTTVKVEDQIGRSLLSWLDGNADRSELSKKLRELLKSLASAPLPVESMLEDNLQKIARLGLLV